MQKMHVICACMIPGGTEIVDKGRQLTEPLSKIRKERPITFAYTPQLTGLADENATISLE
jgi:predicted ATP-grasp superfamily ATP-dependent carboligase